jgi:diguanylate cyclase (GGDEF)-like protein/PAS domain S-box-containing protein
MAQFRIATRRVHFESRPAAIDAVAPAYAMAVVQLGDTWRLTNSEMVNLLQARVDQQFSRMALHLGTAAALLAVILSLVYFVARQIANPIRHLADVADRVSRTGDYRLRAAPTGADETAHLMHAFNAMLGELDRNRSVREELTAAARAADAQRDLVESFPTPILVTSIPDHRVLHANEPAQKWIDETLCDPWVAGMEPQVRARFFQQLSDLDRADEFEVYWRTGDQQRWALLSARRIEFMGQDALVTVFTPINQLKHLEKRLQLLAKVFEASSESIMITDANQFLVTANAAFNRTMGWDLAEVVGRPLSMFDGDREDDTHFERVRQTCIIRGSWQGELWLKRKNGEVFPNWVVMNAVRGADGQLTHFVSASVDISEHKANEARIQHLAQHDALTGLPNRALCLERLNQAVMHALHEGHHVAVVFIDLDRFKNINDSLGHHVGDALLRSVSQRLGEAVREHDTVSRLGGDEFVVVLTRVADVAEVEHIIEQRLIPLVREPHRIGASELNVSCSVGIALYPQDGKDVDHLMRNADAAMYQAKAGGRNHALFFTHDFQQQAQERLAIENSLPWAVERNELELYYQPRVDAVSGRLLGVEALVRWNHPQQGMVSPAAFIPVAEETGNIHAIGAWTIAQATRQHRQWALDGLGAIPISVNISPLQLRDLSIAELVQGHIDDNAIEPGMLELELTESSLMDNAPATMELLKRFKAMGVSLALDDFGTGYSSLNYLHQFPIDKLKIDQSFIRDMLDDPADLAITKAIIGLGHTLGLVVTAEGVEHLAEAEVLREAGCDELQGFLFARPMPAHELAIWLAMRGATARSVPGQQPQTSSGNGNAHRAPALNG